MPTTRIKNLAEVTVLADDDVLPVDLVAPDETRKITKANLLAALGGVVRSVRVATTAAGTLATSFENGDTIDGVVLATGDRILIKDQASGTENGIYVVAASGAPTRAPDADVGVDLDGGAIVWIREGAVNADQLYGLTTNAPISIGVTSLSFGPVPSSVALDRLLANFDTRTFSGFLIAQQKATLQAELEAQGAVRFSGVLTPAQITATAHDYAPTGYLTATHWRLSSNSASITGIAGGAAGRVIVITNVGTEPFSLTREDAGSTAANRFFGDRYLDIGRSVALIYDGTTQRWRPLAHHVGTSGTPNTGPTIADNGDRDYGLGDHFVNLSPGDGRAWILVDYDAGDGHWEEVAFRRSRWAQKTANFTLSVNERVLLIDAAGAITVTLPTPAPSLAGCEWSLLLARDAPGDVTLDRTGTEKIQGVAADYVLSGAWTKWHLFCDGTDWFFI